MSVHLFHMVVPLHACSCIPIFATNHQERADPDAMSDANSVPQGTVIGHAGRRRPKLRKGSLRKGWAGDAVAHPATRTLRLGTRAVELFQESDDEANAGDDLSIPKAHESAAPEPVSAILYVRPHAAPNGDGSRVAPFSSVPEALASPGARDRCEIVLLDGVYAPFRVATPHAHVTIRAAVPDAAVIRAPEGARDAPAAALVTIMGARALCLADLRMEYAACGVWAAEAEDLGVLNCTFIDVRRPIGGTQAWPLQDVMVCNTVEYSACRDRLARTRLPGWAVFVGYALALAYAAACTAVVCAQALPLGSLGRWLAVVVLGLLLDALVVQSLGAALLVALRRWARGPGVGRGGHALAQQF